MVKIKISTAAANVLSPVSVSKHQLRVLGKANRMMTRTIR